MSEAIKNETTEMAVASGYSAIANMDFLAEAMNDDCAGLDFKFDRIKIPSGGMTAFEVPSEDGEGSDLVKEIEAVIDHSFLTYKKELPACGWNVKKISMKEQTVLFERRLDHA